MSPLLSNLYQTLKAHFALYCSTYGVWVVLAIFESFGKCVTVPATAAAAAEMQTEMHQLLTSVDSKSRLEKDSKPGAKALLKALQSYQPPASSSSNDATTSLATSGSNQFKSKKKSKS